MRGLLNYIQAHTPGPIRNLGQHIYDRIPLGVRYGKVFREYSKFLDQSQFWSVDQHREHQLHTLQKLISYAYRNVPFYTKLYNEYRIRPEDINTLEDLRHLPTITKDQLRTSLDDLLSRTMSKSNLQYHTTGGSTGKPVGLYWQADRTVPIERAFMRRQWRWVGFEMEKDRSIVLRGRPLSNGRLVETAHGNQLRISTYDLTAANIDMYVDIIRDYAPVAIQAYPSAIHILGQHVLASGGGSFPSLRVILCGSENLYPWQRDIISKAFNCRVYSWYGQSEYVSLAGECEHSSRYHFYSEYGVTEFIREDGMPAHTGESAEIVATGFNNHAMPLIRYRTEDIARLSTTTACECGRHYPLVDAIEGRLQEMILSKAGSQVSMTALNMHSDVFDNVLQFQFYQDTPGSITLRIVRKPSYSDADEKQIRRELEEKIRNQFDLELEYVTSVETTERGKGRFLIQKLDLTQHQGG